IPTMTNNPSKRPVLEDFDDGDNEMNHLTRKRVRVRSPSDIFLQGRVEWTEQMVYCKVGILDGQSVFLPILTTDRPIEDLTDLVDDNLQTLRMRRLQEYHQPIYIPPMAKANLQAQDDAIFPLLDSVQGFLTSDRQVMLILGDSGSGKSTFNHHLENLLWKNYNIGDPIPLFINLPAIERPDQDLIHKQLKIYDFSDNQILEMKMNRQFILICDGYDGSQLNVNLHITNRFNQRDQWRTRMIISCRTQFLGPVYIERFSPQPTDHYGAAQVDRFQQAITLPFSEKQVQSYVAYYVSLEPRPWVAEEYMLMLTTIPSLMDLVKNPFLLTLTLEALPSVTKSHQELSNIRITRVRLYDYFVDQWVGVNMRRLQNSALNKDDRETLAELVDRGFSSLAVDFSTRLARAIFDKQENNPVVQYIHFRDKNSWRAEFFGTQPMVRLLRDSSPLIRSGSLFQFIHRSMLEYFFSCTVFEPNNHRDKNEFRPQTELGSYDVLPLDPNCPLFKRDLIKEPSIIQFLSERVKQSSDFEKQLHNVVELSKSDTTASTAAANAITILVRVGTLFHGADLRGIRIPGADLSGGQFDSVQLQGADLRGVDFTRSWLRQADLTHTRLEGVRFGELPYLKEEDEVTACAYSPGGSIFVTATRKGLRGIINIYNALTWTRMNTLYIDRERIGSHSICISTNSIAFSPDSRHFVTGGNDGTVRLWDCAEGKKLLEMEEVYGGDVSVAFSPCGKRVVSACRYGYARIWNAETGETIFAIKRHTGYIKSVKFSPDGSRVVLGYYDGTIRFWDAATGESGAVWNAPSGNVSCFAYTLDGQHLASGHYKGVVQLWDTLSGEPGLVLRGGGGFTTSIEFSPDGRLVAISSDASTVRLFNVRDGTLISTFPGHTGNVLDLAFSPDGRQLALAGRDGFVRLWDANSSEASVGWQGPTDVGLNALFTVKGFMLLSVGGNGESVRVWNPLTCAVRPPIPLSSGWLSASAIAPDGRQGMLGGRDGSLRTWDIQTGEAGPMVDGHEDYVRDIFYSPCGRWMLSTSAAKVRLWDLQFPERTQTVRSHQLGRSGNHVYAAFSPTTMMEPRIAITDWTSQLELYDLRTGELLKETWLGAQAKPHSLVFSPNGRQLAIGTEDDSIELWNHEVEEVPIVRLQGHSCLVSCVAYSSCGQWLASGSSDRTVRIWRRHQQQQFPEGGDGVESWSCATVVRGFSEGVQSVSWNQYGPLEFVTKSWDKAVGIWRISDDDEMKDFGSKGGITAHLIWGSNLGRLCAEGLRFEGATGLDSMCEKLLLQRGAH
ncbi:chromatin binding protein, partial [Linnemannia gamsii]